MQQGQGKRSVHWRGGCRRCFVLCFCPGKGQSTVQGLRWRQQRQQEHNTRAEQGPGSKIYSLRFAFYTFPPLHRLGPFHLYHQIKKIFNWKQKISYEVILIFLKSNNCQAASKTFSLQRTTFWKMQCLFNDFIVHSSWLYLCRIHQKILIFLSTFLKIIRKMSGFQQKVKYKSKKKGTVVIKSSLCRQRTCGLLALLHTM